MKSNRSLIYDGFRIAMAYVGTVVGAGFATGQEIIQFFTCYGYSSFWAILISVILFIAAGRKIMHFGRKLNARSYGSLTEYLFGNAAPFVNIYLGLTFVFICGAMFAGAGALFKEQLSIPYAAGALITGLLTLLVTLYGLRGILAVNSVIVPCLIAFSVFVFIYVFGERCQPAVISRDYAPNVLALLKTGISYASFNLVLSIGVLAPMGAEIRAERSLTLGSFLGGGLLGLLLAMGNYTLICKAPEVFYSEVPQMLIVSQIGGAFVYLYMLVVWAEIFTTAIGNLFAIHTIIRENYRISSCFPAVAAPAAGLIICLMGFSNIVSWFYPVLGMIGFVLSAIILVINA
jgi:uncharacterized membrane protein YkvI